MMKKKLLTLVLTLAMALSLAACGGDSAGSGNSGNNAPPAETQEPAGSTSSDASGETYNHTPTRPWTPPPRALPTR